MKTKEEIQNEIRKLEESREVFLNNHDSALKTQLHSDAHASMRCAEREREKIEMLKWVLGEK